MGSTPVNAGLNIATFDGRYRRALIAFFARRIGDRAEAEDLTQEVFVRLARADRHDLRDADAYIFQIAANLIRDRSRQAAFRQSQSQALAETEQRRGEPIDAERILIAKSKLKEVVAVLKQLPARTRDIFLLNRLEGLTHQEIADMFAISPSAVGKHIYKASAILAERLGGEA